jgi:membrane protease YdiL (CAAX protease family)
MSRSLLPQVAILGLVLFFVLGVSLQLLNFVFSAWFVQVFVFLCIPWVFYRLSRQKPSKALSLLAVSPKKPALGAVLGMVFYFAVVLPLMHGASQVLPSSWEKMFDGRAMFAGLGGVEWVLMVVVVVVVAPLCEEVYFRGFIQPKLIQRWGAPMGLLVSSVLFSLIHVDPFGFLARVALGMLFGWLAYASASLWVSMAAHASYNLLVCILFFYVSDSTSSAALPLGQGVLFLWLVLGTGGVVALLWGFGFWAPAPQAPHEPSRHSQMPPVSLWSALRPWLLAAFGSCLLLAAVDHRGIALNMFDMVVTPLPRAARDNPQLQEAIERMQALRQEARKGHVELKKYFELRKQFSQELAASGLAS